jgi:hypothetical protein
VLQLCQKVVKASTATLKEAKELFDLGWGAHVLRYWQEFLNGDFQSARALNHLSGMTADDAIHRLRAGLRQLLAGEVISEPAFLGLEVGWRELTARLERKAAKLGQTPVALWDELARHWLDDTIDYEDVIDVGLRTWQQLNVSNDQALAEQFTSSQ